MKKAIYEEFEKVCMNGNLIIIEKFIQNYNINVNFDDGYFLELIVLRNNINLLKLFIKYGGNVHVNNEGVLRLVAHEGYLELLKYLIYECNADYKVLYESSAYSNKEITKNFIDNLNLTF